MQPFVYEALPTRVVFGSGTLSQLKPEAERLVDALQLSKTIQLQSAILLLVGVVGLWAGGGRLAAGAKLTSSETPSAQQQDKSEFDPRITAFACAVGFAVMFGQNVLFYAFPLAAVVFVAVSWMTRSSIAPVREQIQRSFADAGKM